MIYQMVIYFMINKSKDDALWCNWRDYYISTFWKECCSCIQRKFSFVQEWKKWIGFLGSSMQKEQNGDTFFPNLQSILWRYEKLSNNLYWNMRRFALFIARLDKIYISFHSNSGYWKFFSKYLWVVGFSISSLVLQVCYILYSSQLLIFLNNRFDV